MKTFKCRLFDVNSLTSTEELVTECASSQNGYCTLVKGCSKFSLKYGEPVGPGGPWAEGDRLYCPHINQDMVVGSRGECVGCTNPNEIPRVCVDIAVKLS